MGLNWALTNDVSARDQSYERVKRIGDIVLGVVLFLLLSPFLLAAAIAVRLSSPGPIFFRQLRVGRNNRLFHILKFRTMFVDADQIGPLITSRDDHRVTRIGAFLRRTKLDEFPQLINVVRGDMSLVGPRPQVPRFVCRFPDEYRDVVLAVRPGITGPTQIKFRNEEDLLAGQKDSEQFYVRELLPVKCQMDAEYVQRQSLGYDVRVVCETAAIFMRGNARKVGHGVSSRAVKAVTRRFSRAEDENVDVPA